MARNRGASERKRPDPRVRPSLGSGKQREKANGNNWLHGYLVACLPNPMLIAERLGNKSGGLVEAKIDLAAGYRASLRERHVGEQVPLVVEQADTPDPMVFVHSDGAGCRPAPGAPPRCP